MRQKNIYCLIVAFLLIASLCIFGLTRVNAKESANGYHVEEVIRDKFNKDTLDSSWQLNGSTVEFNYNALHCISPVSYGSGPIMNKVRMSNKTRYEFTIYPNEGRDASNISFNIGVPTPSSQQKEPDIDARLQLWDNQLVFVDYQNNLAVPKGEEESRVLREFSGLYSSLERTDVSIIIERKSDYKTEIYAEYRRGGELVYSSQSHAFTLNLPRYADGYCGFFWDCVEMDLTNFRIYTDDVLVFEDNLSENTLTYPSADASLGNFHINSTLNEAKCYVSKVSSIKMDAASESIMNSYTMERQNNVSNPYELTYSIKINELNNDSLVGFGFALSSADSKIDAKNAIGFLRKDDKTVEVVAIRNGVVDRSNGYQIALSKLSIGKYMDYSITVDYANNAYLTVNGLTFKFQNIEYLGQTGVGLIDLGGEKASNVEMKEFSLMKNSYRLNDSEDVSNNFTGRKKAEEDELDSPYINTQKYFLGSGVSLDEDWATGETALLFQNAGPYSGFGYRKQYSEFICEFDVDMLTRKQGHFIGLSFGRQSVVDVLVQASTTSKAFLLRCDVADDGSTSTTQVLWGNGCEFENGSDSKQSDVNVFDSESTKYHFMFIGRNRTIYVYYKAADAPESEMAVLRAVIPNVNIDGYVSIVGNNGISFSVKNYKMVNLSDDLEEGSELTIRETFDSKESVSGLLALDGMSKVVDNKLSMNNSTISIYKQNLYEIIRFTTYELENSFQIMFSKDKKIVFDAENNRIVINENGTKTTYDCSDMNFKNIKGKRFEIRIFGDEITIGYKGYYDPMDKLSTVLITHKLSSGLEWDNLSFSANGKVTIDDLYIFSLDDSAECITHGYDTDPDNANIWTVKSDFDPSKVYGAAKQEEEQKGLLGCKSAVGGISISLSLIGLAFAFRKRRELI